MKHAVHFEEEFIVGLLGDGHGEREIKSWADGIVGHYERKRRVELLEKARAIILREEAEDSTFRVDVVTTIPSPVPPTTAQADRAASPEEEAWGFDGEAEPSSAADADGWGFEDDVPVEEAPAVVEAEPAAKDPEDDPEDAWGWNDGEQEENGDEGANGDIDGDGSTDSSVWDDPWGDVQDSTLEPSTQTQPATTKPASRLERLSNKSKKTTKTAMSPPVHSPVPVAPPPPTPAMPSSMATKQTQPVNGATRIHVQTESYLVAGRMKELLALVEEIIREAADLTSSGVFSSHGSHASVGGTIAPTAASVLDLYRALYPVHAAAKLSSAAKWSLLFANNCTWLSGEVARVDGKGAEAGEKLGECVERLREVGELWYEDVVVSLN